MEWATEVAASSSLLMDGGPEGAVKKVVVMDCFAGKCEYRVEWVDVSGCLSYWSRGFAVVGRFSFFCP